jgi:hypothetical protein
MQTKTIRSLEHTSADGKLTLRLDVGFSNADVSVVTEVKEMSRTDVDANGWPIGYFERIPGSMPDMKLAVRHGFEP